MAVEQNTRINIYINNDSAKRQLIELDEELRKTTEELKKMESASQGNTIEAAKLREAQKSLEARMAETRKEAGLHALSYKQLKAEYQSLNNAWSKAIPGSEQRAKLEAELKLVKARMDEVSLSTKRSQSTFSQMADGFNKYFAIITAMAATITGLSLTFRKLSENVAHMDDVYADVQKTTGLTKEGVAELNEELKKMDTRTTREELNKLAEDAGKLGISAKEDILDFVDAGNQIKVSLGEDLGEDAIKEIGKLTDVYKASTEELETLDLKGKMLSIGSAINALGQSSTASESYLVEFSKRLSGVASQAGLDVQNILGYASALDQTGQAVEMSATAFQGFVTKMFSDPAKFAKIAGMEVGKFTTMMRTDANSAIVTVLKSLKEKGGFEALIPIFNEMNLDGARAIGVLSALSTNIDMVTTAQKVSTTAFAEANSITGEYSKKNNNLQAELDKARKKFSEASLELGENLSPALLHSTNLTTGLIKTIPVLISFFKEYGGILLYTTGVIVAYTVAVKVQAMWEKRAVENTLLNTIAVKSKSAVMAAAAAAEQLYAAALSLATGNLRAANNAMKIFFATIKTNPIGILAAAVVGLGILIYKLSTQTTTAEAAMKKFGVTTESISDATQGYIRTLEEEKNAYTASIELLKNENLPREQKLKLINDLKEKYPGLLSFMDAEKMGANELNVVLDRLNENYEKRYKLAATQGMADAYGSKIVDIEKRKIEIEEEINNLRKGNPTEEKANKIKALLAEESVINNLAGNYREKVNQFLKDAKTIESEINKPVNVETLKTDIQETTKFIESNIDKINQARHKGNGEEIAYYEKIGKELEAKRSVLKKELEAAEKAAKEAKGKEETDAKPKGGSSPDNRLKNLDDDYAKALEAEKKKRADGLIDAEQYEAKLYALKVTYLQRKIAIVGKETEEGKKANDELLDMQIKSREKSEAERAKEEDAILKNREKLTDNLKSVSDDYQKFLEDQNGKEILAIEQKYARIEEDLRLSKEKELQFYAGNAEKIAEIEATYSSAAATLSANRVREIEAKKQEQKIKEEEKFQEKLKSLREEYSGKTSLELEAEELASLEAVHQKKLLSEEEFEKLKADIRKKYSDGRTKEDLAKLQESAANTQTVVGMMSDAIGALQQNETQEIETEHAKQLGSLNERMNAELAANEGNEEAQKEIRERYAKEKEQLDYQTAKKKLDIEKKFADANFGIQVAQIISAGALAVMQAFAQLGPIGGAIAAVLVAATTALQVSTANKQRQAVKSQTLESPGGSSGGINTPAPVAKRVIIPEGDTNTEDEVKDENKTKAYASGKYDVISEQDGKEYKSVPLVKSITGIVSRPTLVAEEPELVVGVKDFPYLRKHVNFPLVVQAIQDARQQRTVPARASGEYSSIPHGSDSVSGNKELERLIALNIQVLTDLKNNPLYAAVVLDEFEAKREMLQRAKDRATKK